MPIPPGILATLKYKLPHNALKKIIITGDRFGAEEAKNHGILDHIHPQNDLKNKVLEMAHYLKEFGENRSSLKSIKEEMYKEITNDCFNSGLANGHKVIL